MADGEEKLSKERGCVRTDDDRNELIAKVFEADHYWNVSSCGVQFAGCHLTDGS
ncbi:hypothetical protein [Methylomusa anaerophila]|uniref:hypothetical protein n=1 Tax=Methylomusa anaerophila TaxID=1930071 RepID=UPI002D1FAD2C|nr:hypothetical protein [Methylomusa anaerophila]